MDNTKPEKKLDPQKIWQAVEAIRSGKIKLKDKTASSKPTP